MLPENANSQASSATVSRASSVTAEEISPPGSQGSVTVKGDSPSEASSEASHEAGSQDQAFEINPSLKVSISVCRIASVSIDFFPVV